LFKSTINTNSVSEAPVYGVTVSFALFVTPAYLAEIVGDLELVTFVVVTVKVALVLSLSTVTLDGTEATEVLLLDSDTTVFCAAVPLSVTVPVEVLPPTTVEGLRESDDSEGSLTVRVLDLVTPPEEAEIVTAVELDTG
jgi:hypothetical protein